MKKELVIELLKLIDENGKQENSSEWLEVGTNYLIRSVTMIYTGKLKRIYDDYLLLEKGAWIPETERWMNTLKECKFKEVEPYPNDLIVFKNAILDITEIKNLPTEQL